MSLPNVFANQPGPIPLIFLDQNFDAITQGDGSNVGYAAPYVGAAMRTQQSKNSDQVSVLDFAGVVGNGSNDDTAGIQAAINTGKDVFFPNPISFYNVTSPLILPFDSGLTGESGTRTIIRNTAGTEVFQLTAGSLTPNDLTRIHSLRIGGTGTLLDASSGFTGYASRLNLWNVHFESDASICMSVDAIFADWSYCSFGFFRNTGVNANLRHIVDSGVGSSPLSNLNSVRRCIFQNSGASQTSVSLNIGVLWRFQECDWEQNGICFTSPNIAGVVIEQCYMERCTAPGPTSALFNFGPTTSPVLVRGGFYNGSLLTSGQSLFGYGGSTTPLILDNVIAGTSSSGFVLFDNSNVTHTYPNQSVVVKNLAMSAGNSADPVFTNFANLVEGVAKPYTPVATSLTVSGTVTITGSYNVIGRQVFFEVLITPTGGGTSTSVFGTTTITLPAGMTPKVNGVCPTLDTTVGTNLGVARAATNGTLIPPSWTVLNSTVCISGTYPI